ncbi:unnamed protein product [Clonostachys byssicola]|uniref:AAA+ ATPase domain-containing protein n=1 Tax=Clonostachys byssicola TaxID=160290 RepID=A0A9N9YA05_9HYPO|nr:unnamed protein product [Clonostachys byssicola]
MARTKQTSRGGRRKAPSRATRGGDNIGFMALQEEAERRERILADRRRVEAKWRPKVPEIRKVNFENFKNRFGGTDEPEAAVDVLMVGPSISAQMRRERSYRHREDLARMRKKYLDIHDNAYERKRRPITAADKAKIAKRTEALQSTDTEISRIRVQSQPVLGYLTSLMNESNTRSTPRTFMRPFKPLIYFQPKMKEILATLEEKWADFEEASSESAEELSKEEAIEVVDEVEEFDDAVEDDEAQSDEDEEGGDDEDDTESLQSVDSNVDEDIDSLMDTPEALRDMRCYVKFIDEEVMPLHTRFDSNEVDKVKFDDLWYLFRPGDLIYMPAAGEAGGRYHEVWRTYKVTVPEPEVADRSLGWEFGDDFFGSNDDSNNFKIKAYYIDHDGSSFGAVRKEFTIEPFIGERQIDSLDIFPIRYRHGHEELIDSLKSQGRKFIDFLDDRHQQYSAWSLTRNPPSHRHRDDPDDEILDSEDYEKMRHPEFVESDVIVDLREAYQKMPDWRPSFHQLAINHSMNCEAQDDEMPVQHWFDGNRQSLAYSQTEIVQKSDGVEVRQRRDNLNQDAFLRVRVKGSRTFETNPALLKLRDEDLVLVPKRMFAYILRERRFLPVDLNFLNPVRREPNVFENLRIQSDYKDVVRGLVMSHFQRKALERRYADSAMEGPNQDLIQGKGRGLVVLLHGVPGVGKTATAEAVAMENRKPLFVITCGDLGLSPHEVESSLKNVFRLAHLWDCVLLLDEADVFLSQRSQLDMKRNALVSVFLRVLEYYNGLLFLTTNRVGQIDSAFKSRIHLSLYYPPLDKTQTRDIFKINIAKLKEIEAERHRMTGEAPLVIKDAEILEFATKHYEDLARSTGCWNGRQIRSAFQIASSLAIHSHANQSALARSRGQLPAAAPVLDRSFFEKVQLSTQSFDKHMKKESGMYEQEVPMRGSFSGRE